MAQYLVFLRGVNVGGNNMVKMAELKAALERDGFTDVRTYIQSGNVFVSSSERSKTKVADAVAATVKKTFKIAVKTVAFTKSDWQAVIAGAPKWWAVKDGWRNDVYIVVPPYNVKQALTDIGVLKPDIEYTHGAKGVIYASLLLAKYGSTTLGRIPGKPVYKEITIRNYNTANKLLKLFL